MQSVADELRGASRAAVLPASRRLTACAWHSTWGMPTCAGFAAAKGVSVAEARRMLSAGRRIGRVASVANDRSLP